MKHMQVLKRAWQILWDYRALWVFGIILALTTTSPSTNSNYQISDGDPFPYQIDTTTPIWPQLGEAAGEVFDQTMDEMKQILSVEYEDQLEQQLLQAFLWFIGVMLTLALIGKVFRYVSEISLIKMVDETENSGQKLPVGEGFKLGWSREAWNIFLVDLVIEVPFILAVLLVVSLVLVPVLVWSGDNTAGALVSMLTSIGLAMLLGLLLLVVRAVLWVIKPVIRREVALSQCSVGQGIRQGFNLTRQYWKETGLMGLILFGIRIVWPLVMFPVIMLSLALAVMLGGGAAFLVGGEAFVTGAPEMVWAIFTGLILFILVLAIPVGFFYGLLETYQSTTWTLTYREITALKALENGDTPSLEAEGSAA